MCQRHFSQAFHISACHSTHPLPSYGQLQESTSAGPGVMGSSGRLGLLLPASPDDSDSATSDRLEWPRLGGGTINTRIKSWPSIRGGGGGGGGRRRQYNLPESRVAPRRRHCQLCGAVASGQWSAARGLIAANQASPASTPPRPRLGSSRAGPKDLRTMRADLSGGAGRASSAAGRLGRGAQSDPGVLGVYP